MRALICLTAMWVGAVSLFAARSPEIVGPRSGKWAHETPKALAPDGGVLWGRLDNGFRYALLPHKGVPGRVTLQLVVLAGSLDERPNELGIAHYIEHLAFGGSKNFKAEDMVSLFQRLGVEYGSDVNAVTTFDYTAFRLDFRENEAALINEGLRLFRDFGDGVAFEPRIIEQERRVVLAELRNRNTLSGQQQQASLPVVFRGLQFPQRSPGGSEGLIAKFPREQFLEYYRRNYRSDLMILVGAGDFDPKTLESVVKATFADMARPRDPIPLREEGKLDARAMRAGVFRIGGVNSASVEVASVVPFAPKVDTREVQVERQRREFVMALFDERLRTQMKEGFGGEAAYQELLGNGVAMATTRVAGREWDEGLKELDQMVRMTLERGLDPGDIAEHRKRKLKLATHMLDQLPTLDPGMLCEALTDSITEHTVYIGFASKFAWMREWLERFTPQEAQQVFRSLWVPAAMSFHVSGGVDMELTGDKIVQEVNKARKNGLPHVMPRHNRDAPFTLPKFATPTEVVETRDLPALNAKLLRFGNNVRLNFVTNRQEPGLLHATVRVGNGLIDMPGNKPALKEFGLNTLLGGGAIHFRPEQLNALIEDRLLGFSFDISDRDAFTFRGTMASEQLEVFLGIVADFLHAPQFNSYVHREQRLLAAIGRMSQTMGMGEGMRALTDYLFKGDARFTWGAPKDYISMSVLDVKRWMEPALSRGYVEVTIVGDIAEPAAVATMTKTLGALKPRAATKTMEATPKPVQISAPAGFKRIEFIGEQNVGLVVGTWPLAKELHIRDQAAMELLAKLLEIRVRTELRENLGLAYSPSAEFQPYDGFQKFATLRAQVDCAPNDTTRVGTLIEKIGADLAKEGVKEGEFIGARGILKSQFKQAFRDNGFLVSALMRAQERPQEIEEIMALQSGVLDQLTLEEVNALAKEVLVATNCRTAAIVPKAFVGLFEAK
ncbi:MAG: insulinase family protein [Verrucomicrobiota bacterium]